MTILVTGARGSVARAVVDRFVAAGEDVRAAGSDPSKTPPIEGVPIAGFDLADRANLKAVLDGVDRVFMYAVHSGIENFLDAARDAGVRHIVLLSSIAAAFPGNPIGDMHLAVENPLRESGIAYTILRPGMFATNALWWADAVRSGVVALPYPEAHVTPIHEGDMADVAFAALTGSGHEGAIHPLDGPESLTVRRQVELIGEAIGRDLRIEVLPHEKAAASMPAPVLEMLAGAVGKPQTPGPNSWAVTGIPSRGFAQWAADHADDFR
ncbi:SDR family oxidoreductase [Phytomonospora endophytica]|uniref:Uncharacterized protein YbjT (DUF2867 family) n=1 Tax=Phytomonospora endophytica TaxID=714109 RepID=A0A841F8S3_9ACTN|nr:NAD(P)H-binding protein [Phytomonospora endophytica]MBB6032636.1 uncharacterized protein YbjT (DUF2867 family) [Phytomonospora endophytica]GIG66214.1 nucleotide-diphosphate-sugar epimerase [Phytomonospora endophytica]